MQQLGHEAHETASSAATSSRQLRKVPKVTLSAAPRKKSSEDSRLAPSLLPRVGVRPPGRRHPVPTYPVKRSHETGCYTFSTKARVHCRDALQFVDALKPYVALINYKYDIIKIVPRPKDVEKNLYILSEDVATYLTHY
eukprot:scaffold187911_cov36-Tisochrysis_lutea.AAC.2